MQPGDDSSFPIHLFTSGLAMQANIAYHITSLLLLAHKPRLLKLAGEPHRQPQAVAATAASSSQALHVQSVAGIAARNDFPEQWDPVTVGALLYVARDMTHPAQQQALEACFSRVKASTGIALDEELVELREGWAAARSSEREA